MDNNGNKGQKLENHYKKALEKSLKLISEELEREKIRNKYSQYEAGLKYSQLILRNAMDMADTFTKEQG